MILLENVRFHIEEEGKGEVNGEKVRLRCPSDAHVLASLSQSRGVSPAEAVEGGAR